MKRLTRDPHRAPKCLAHKGWRWQAKVEGDGTKIGPSLEIDDADAALLRRDYGKFFLPAPKAEAPKEEAPEAPKVQEGEDALIADAGSEPVEGGDPEPADEGAADFADEDDDPLIDHKDKPGPGTMTAASLPASGRRGHGRRGRN